MTAGEQRCSTDASTHNYCRSSAAVTESPPPLLTTAPFAHRYDRRHLASPAAPWRCPPRYICRRCAPVPPSPPAPAPTIFFWRLDLRDRLPLPRSLFARPDAPPRCHCRAPPPHRPRFPVPSASPTAFPPRGCRPAPVVPAPPPLTPSITATPSPTSAKKNHPKRAAEEEKPPKTTPTFPKSTAKTTQKVPWYRESIGFLHRRLKPLGFGLFAATTFDRAATKILAPKTHSQPHRPESFPVHASIPPATPRPPPRASLSENENPMKKSKIHFSRRTGRKTLVLYPS